MKELIIFFPIFISLALAKDGCLLCHKYRNLGYKKDNKIIPCDISSIKYLHSVHRDVDCSECHTKIEAYPHNPKNIRATCSNKCHVIDPVSKKFFSHEKVVKTWEKSIHGKYHNKAPNIFPGCSYCHINKELVNIDKLSSAQKGLQKCTICHTNNYDLKIAYAHILSRSEIPLEKNGFTFGHIKGIQRDGWEIVKLCASCHADKKKMKEAIEIMGIKDEEREEKILEAVKAYFNTMHGKMLKLYPEDTRAADCLDCHTHANGNFHDIYETTDIRSSTNPDILPKTCGRSDECHPLVAKWNDKNFATTKWVHMDPAVFKYENPIAQAIVFGVEHGMFYMAASVLLMGAGLVFLALFREIRNRSKEDNKHHE